MLNPSALSARHAPIDWELLFCSHVLQLPSLHWGLWDADEALTLEGFRRAQIRFRTRVVEAIPTDCVRVLDVGCGRGDTSRELASRGHHVTAIAPIVNYVEEMHALAQHGVAFEQADFVHYRHDTGFDAIVFSESCGHFRADVVFAQSARLLRPNGVVIVANMFRRDNTHHPVARHQLDEFLSAARAHGFVESKRLDLTASVLPTTQLLTQTLSLHALPGLEFVDLWLSTRRGWRGWLSRAIRRLCAGQIERHRAALDLYLRRLSPTQFATHGCYLLSCFRREMADAGAPASASSSTS